MIVLDGVKAAYKHSGLLGLLDFVITNKIDCSSLSEFYLEDRVFKFNEDGIDYFVNFNIHHLIIYDVSNRQLIYEVKGI